MPSVDRDDYRRRAEQRDIAGQLLDVRVVGPGDGPPRLVFLHEALGSVDLWRDVPGDIAEAVGERAVVYSRYGHGWSSVQHEVRSREFMDHEALVVLPAVLEQCGVVDPILIGHSDGASIAVIHAAAAEPAGLVLIAPHVFTETVCLDRMRSVADGFPGSDLAAKMARYHTDPARTFGAWIDVWLDPEFVDWNVEHLLASITCPTLLIQGREDEYGTERQVAAIREGVTGPCDELLLDGCGHAPQFDRPETTRRAIAGFVRDLVRR